MASNSIELDIGGKYSAAQMFKQWDTDVKTMGKSMKDMGGAATNVANSIATAFGGKLDGSLKTSIGLITEMARGGIWGVMQTVATTAIGFIADKWNEAKEAVVQYSEICRTRVVETMKGIGENFTNISKQMSEATANAKELLSVANGEAARNAQLKLHELNIQTMQQITDDMTEASRTHLLASQTLEASYIKAAEANQIAANATKAATDIQALSVQKRQEAENRLSLAQEQRAQFEDTAKAHGMGWLARYEELQTKAAMTTEELMANGMALETALQFRKSTSLALAQFEEQHKNEITALNEVTKLETAAKTDLEVAKREETSATRALTAAQNNEEVVRIAQIDQIEQAKWKMMQANEALEKETAAKEAATKQAEREAKLALLVEKVKADAIEKDIDYTEYVELVTKALEQGYSEESALNLVRARYKQAMEESAKQQEESNKNAKSGKGGQSASQYKELVNAIKEGVGGTSVNVSSGGVGDGVDDSTEIITQGKVEREVRDEQRKVRDRTDAIKKSSAAMQSYLKGKMSPEVAKKFQEKLKSQGLSLKEFKTMTTTAMKNQLLTHTQAVKQQEAVLNLWKAIQKMGLK